MDKAERKLLNKQLVKIVLPIAFQNFMGSAVSASDTVMMMFLDQDAVSAVSLATKVAFVMFLFCCAFGTGLSIMAAQYWGKKDMKTVEEVLAVSLRYTLIVGVIFSVAAFAFPHELMRIFTNDANLIEIGAGYLKVVSIEYVLIAFEQIYLVVLRICDKATISSVIVSTGVVLNIFLNAVFIFGLFKAPAMGVNGAALATVLSLIYEAVFALIVMYTTKSAKIRLGKMFFGASRVLHRDYWKYTFPVLINQFGWGGGVTMYSVLLGHLGTDATSAYSLADQVRNIVASFCWGLASGASIIIGNFLGRGELERAKKAGAYFVKACLVIGVLSGIVIMPLIPVALKFASLKYSPQALEYAKIMLFMMCYYIIGNSFNSTTIGGIFPSGGDTKFGMICDTVTLWGVVLPIAFAAAFIFKLPVAIIAFILTWDEFVKIPVVALHYRKYKWVKNITREEASL